MKLSIDTKRMSRLATLALAAGLFAIIAPEVMAQGIQLKSGQTIGQVSNNVANSMTGASRAVAAVCYICAVVMGVVAVFKFKAHSDNPDREPIKKPIMYVLVAVMLAAIPETLGVGIGTLWGGAATLVPVY